MMPVHTISMLGAIAAAAIMLLHPFAGEARACAESLVLPSSTPGLALESQLQLWARLLRETTHTL